MNRTTLKDIAQVVGLSPRAVSGALNGTGRVSEALKERIFQVAKQLNYRPNVMARALVQKKTYLLGAIFPYANVSFFNDIISGIEERCSASAYDMLLGNANLLDEADERPAFMRIIDRGVDGILCSPDYREAALFHQIEKEGPPTVQVMTRIIGSSLPFIGVDNKKGGTIATAYLISLGHRNIGFIHSSKPHYAEIEDRYAGYLRTLIQNGIQLDSETYTVYGTLTVAGGYTAVSQLITRCPQLTAIFVPADYAAIGAVRACIDAGLRIPQDISIIGFDDLSIAEHQIVYPLTTVAQPKREIGITAFDMLIKLINHTPVENKEVTPELKIRSTTGAART